MLSNPAALDAALVAARHLALQALYRAEPLIAFLARNWGPRSA